MSKDTELDKIKNESTRKELNIYSENRRMDKYREK
jgi:hypothetical protein